MATPLPFITTLARSGALDRAWALFEQEGYDNATADPAALAVKGRLLKDKALRAAGDERASWLSASEEAYAAADALAPEPWLLINVATLAGLQGDWGRAASTAKVVLARLDDAVSIAETPYYIAATRAEAHLLSGDSALASAELAEAIALNPEGWSDHATTLRQFGRIMAARGDDSGWLDAHRPPASLHFAGHLGIAERDAAVLRPAIDAFLAEARIGFAYGALAAGADIIIAEAVLASGAELHVYLPTRQTEFRKQSVVPYGAGWAERYDACLELATEVHEVTTVSGDYEPMATALAADMAMGAAVLNARQLESKAVQLLIVDGGPGPFGTGASTARDGMTWQTTGNSQKQIPWPRSAPVAPSAGRIEGRADRRLMALIELQLSGLDGLDDQSFANVLDDAVTPFFASIAALPDGPVMNLPRGAGKLLCFDSVPRAAAFARRLHMLDPPDGHGLIVAGHYGLIHVIKDGVIGPSLNLLSAISAATLPGTFIVSEAFATVMSLSNEQAFSATDLGERGAVHLYSLQ